MTERDDRHDLSALRERLTAARKQLAAMRVSSERKAGPADPATGESWHRGNVLGHVNEMLPFWTEQIRLANAGSERSGATSQGAERRRQASTPVMPPPAQLREIRGVRVLLSGRDMRPT